jgi:hypothetical protein
LRYTPGISPGRDHFMDLRLESLRRNALKFRPVMSEMLRYAPNGASAEKCRRLIREYEETFGPLSWKDRALSVFVRGTAWLENRRIRKHGEVMRQPPKIKTVYPEREQVPESDSEVITEKTVA